MSPPKDNQDLEKAHSDQHENRSQDFLNRLSYNRSSDDLVKEKNSFIDRVNNKLCDKSTKNKWKYDIVVKDISKSTDSSNQILIVNNSNNSRKIELASSLETPLKKLSFKTSYLNGEMNGSNSLKSSKHPLNSEEMLSENVLQSKFPNNQATSCLESDFDDLDSDFEINCLNQNSRRNNLNQNKSNSKASVVCIKKNVSDAQVPQMHHLPQKPDNPICSDEIPVNPWAEYDVNDYPDINGKI